MKNIFIKSFLILFTVNLSYAQAWMTNLDIAENLALVQNKMVLMVWEETTKYPYPVLVNADNGKTLFIENLFEDETVTPLIWEHFIPVIVSENQYADLYMAIKDNRTQRYINKFNDDSIKIMDINGNILNVSGATEDFENITTLIEDYAINTAFLALELKGYKNDKDFYSAYFLASKYLDFSMYSKGKLRSELIDLANIYLDEASILTEGFPIKEQLALKQRTELLKIQESLITERPKKVLRQLKRMDAENVEVNNKPFVAFLYYTAYSILKDETNRALWESEISSVNLKKAQLIINLNS